MKLHVARRLEVIGPRPAVKLKQSIVSFRGARRGGPLSLSLSLRSKARWTSLSLTHTLSLSLSEVHGEMDGDTLRTLSTHSPQTLRTLSAHSPHTLRSLSAHSPLTLRTLRKPGRCCLQVRTLLDSLNQVARSPHRSSSSSPCPTRPRGTSRSRSCA